MKIGKRMLRQKPLTQVTIKPAVRQIALFGSLAVMLFVTGWFVYFNQPKESYGAVTGDYRSKATGNWNATGTWQRYNGSTWVNATATPTSADGVITILSGHTVTVTADVTVDQTVVAAGGAIVINSSRYLYENNGTGTDLQVDGAITVTNSGYLTQNSSSTIVVNGTVTLASGSTDQIGTSATFTINNGGRVINSGSTLPATAGKWIVNSGGTFQHNINGGNLPLATWNTGSTCEITGATNTAPGNLNQSFKNFTWNCASQASNINLNGAFTSIGGDLTVVSTNASQLQLASAAYSLNVTGNYVQSGGTNVLSTSAAANATLNINGNYTQTGGTFSVMTGNGMTGTVNVTGNWSHTAGTITVGGNSSTNAQFIFNKSGSQTFTASGNTVSGNVDFTVNSGSTLVMGTNILTGRNYTLSSGAGIQIGSAAGIVNAGLFGANGNIQTTTRNYNTGASYTYNGSAAQVTGDGLPVTIANLTVNNSNGLTLTSSVAVSNTITFTSGKIITGLLNELSSTNSSSAGVTGHSSSSYVVGVMRRTVSGTGSYDFPIGTLSNYEMSNITLSGATGFTNIVSSFTSTNPLSALLPLVSVVVNALAINRILDYGYWTLTPNNSMTGGTYTVTLKETGYTASSASPAYCVVKRPNSLSAWQSVGTHNYALQTESNGVVTSVRSGLTSFSDFAIGYGEYLQWENPVLISGVGGQVGAVYKFPGVSTGVDAWVEIVGLQNGATLSDIDYSTGGYTEAWQPFINAAANVTSSILWRITYKVMGTNTDTSMGNLELTAVDVDGGNSMREFVEATNIYSYAVDPATTLTVTYGNMGYKALGGTTSIANIDTSYHDAMFQINHRNVNSFFYETGVVNSSASTGTRQFSLYFKYFMSGNTGLPIKLISFNAKYVTNEVSLQWATASETNNDYFTIERSADGEHFEKVLTMKGAGTSHSTIRYNTSDKFPLSGLSYYRLKQTDFNGKFGYSEAVAVSNHAKTDGDLEIKSVAPTLFHNNFNINFICKEDASVDFMLTSISGQTMARDHINARQGFNSYEFNDQQNIPTGIYFVVLLYNDEKVSYKVIKI